MTGRLALAIVAVAAIGDSARADSVALHGYLETYYQLHLQNPENRITNLRGFDDRSRTFTLSNLALDVAGETGPLVARIVLQFGTTGASYYSAEPERPELWQHVQTATIAGTRGDYTVEGGLFLSPIGTEALAVKDNAQWSRSNLFFGLPFYHTGARVRRTLGDSGWTATLAVYNGWNSVVDGNDVPSVAASASYASANTTAQVLYFGGIERADDWRHLVDAYVQHAVTDRITLGAHGDAGIELNDEGTSTWLAGALYAKATLAPTLYAALRGDIFHEQTDGAATIFWPVATLGSLTVTLGYAPVPGVSLRAEYRHDHASGDAFFGGRVATDPISGAFVPDRTTQDTLTVGATAWF